MALFLLALTEGTDKISEVGVEQVLVFILAHKKVRIAQRSKRGVLADFLSGKARRFVE